MHITRAALTAVTAAAILAGPFAAAPALAQRKKEKVAAAPKLTKEVQNALAAAQTAIKPPPPAKAKASEPPQPVVSDWATALTHLRAAEAVPARNAEDEFYIAQYKLQIAQGLKDDKLLVEGIEAMLEHGRLSVEEQPKYVRNLAALAVRADNWPEATRQYERLAQMQPNDPTVIGDLARIYIRNKQTPQALAMLKRAIDTAEAAGQKPEEGIYGSRFQIAYDGKMAAEVQPAAIALIKAYPTQKNWNAGLFSWRSGIKFDEQTELDWYRLMRASGALTGEGEYLDYAISAHQRGLPGEAKAALDEAQGKGVLDAGKPNVKELRALVPAAKVAADKASLPALEKQARAAGPGKLARATADGWLSHGEWAKAADLYRLALTKGGEDAGLVNTRLGYALAMSGDKAGAAAAFAAVSGGPRASLAQYWSLWVSQRA